MAGADDVDRIRQSLVPDGSRDEILFCFFLTTRAHIYLPYRAMDPGSNLRRRTTGNGSENHPAERIGHPPPDHAPGGSGRISLATCDLVPILIYDTNLRYIQTAVRCRERQLKLREGFKYLGRRA